MNISNTKTQPIVAIVASLSLAFCILAIVFYLVYSRTTIDTSKMTDAQAGVAWSSVLAKATMAYAVATLFVAFATATVVTVSVFSVRAAMKQFVHNSDSRYIETYGQMIHSMHSEDILSISTRHQLMYVRDSELHRLIQRRVKASLRLEESTAESASIPEASILNQVDHFMNVMDFAIYVEDVCVKNNAELTNGSIVSWWTDWFLREENVHVREYAKLGDYVHLTGRINRRAKELGRQ